MRLMISFTAPRQSPWSKMVNVPPSDFRSRPSTMSPNEWNVEMTMPLPERFGPKIWPKPFSFAMCPTRSGHLAGRLVRERERADHVRGHATLEEARDSMRDHAGFARSRAGEDEHGAGLMFDGLCLGRIHLGAATTAPWSHVCSADGRGVCSRAHDSFMFDERPRRAAEPVRRSRPVWRPPAVHARARRVWRSSSGAGAATRHRRPISRSTRRRSHRSTCHPLPEPPNLVVLARVNKPDAIVKTVGLDPSAPGDAELLRQVNETLSDVIDLAAARRGGEREPRATASTRSMPSPVGVRSFDEAKSRIAQHYKTDAITNGGLKIHGLLERAATPSRTGGRRGRARSACSPMLRPGPSSCAAGAARPISSRPT